MIDIHSHILPGIDDGAKNLRETMEIAKIAEKEGITHMIATPHFSFKCQDFVAKVREEIVKLNEVLEKEAMTLRIYAGAETFLNLELLDRLEKESFLTLNGTDYVLVEFPLGEVPLHTEELLYRIRLMGKKPIIAHPERYKEVMEDPNIVKKWIEQGNFIQINATSILGVSGRRSEKTAKHLLKHNLVHILATDTHSPRSRKPALKEALKKVEGWTGKKTSHNLMKNAERVFHNQELVIEDPVEFPYGYNFLQRMGEKLKG